MKTQLMALALLTGAVVAAPAVAQGTFSGPQKPGWTPPRPPAATPYVPPKPAERSSSTAGTSGYGTPKPAEPYKPFKPYESHPGTSLFGPDGKPKRQGTL